MLYTMNTIAIYLGYTSWREYMTHDIFDSEWGYDDNTFYVQALELGDELTVHYLNRTVVFTVVDHEGRRALQVLESANSSLRPDDIVYIYRLRVGDIIEAEKVLRTGSEGNYRTKGEITQIDYMASHD